MKETLLLKMNAGLTEAFDHLYEIFARYTNEYNFAQHSNGTRSLRNLTRDDWEKMNESFDISMLLYSNASAFRHFLPRLLESEITESGSWGPWGLEYRLKMANWLQWSSDEVEALRAVFLAWTREKLTHRDKEFPIDFLSELGDSLVPHLEMWLAARPHEVAEWLWTLEWQKQSRELDWMILPHVEAALEAAFFENPEGEWGHALSSAVELIRSLHNRERLETHSQSRK